MNKTACELEQRVLDLIGGKDGGPREFASLALDIFAFQYRQNPLYRAWCERRAASPATVQDWRDIPAVPTGAFKHLTIACFPRNQAVAEFHTSGTTGGNPGRHYFKTLRLYHAACAPNFAAHLFPDNARLPALILTPSPAEAPHSSLVHMLSVVAPQGRYFGQAGALRVGDLAAALQTDQPVCLLGTAFAFAHLFDHCARKGLRFRLPPGSRAMETGGFKGRARELARAELHALFPRYLGIAGARVVNEYGMTELSTQFYDQTMRLGRATEVKLAPQWARVTIMDPLTGREAAPGQPGLVRVLDLANLYSAICIQTEDLGVATDAGFVLLGRAPAADARGCSLTAETLRLA
jgi:hypothetical protein